MFERFTDSARQVVESAQELAESRDDAQIETAHLLLGVYDSSASVASVLVGAGVTRQILEDAISGADRQALASLGVDLDAISAVADFNFGDAAISQPEKTRRRIRTSRQRTSLPFSGPAKSCLEQSLRIALGRKDKFICAAHVALAAVSKPQTLSNYLSSSGCSVEQLRIDLAGAVSHQ